MLLFDPSRSSKCFFSSAWRLFLMALKISVCVITPTRASFFMTGSDLIPSFSSIVLASRADVSGSTAAIFSFRQSAILIFFSSSVLSTIIPGISATLSTPLTLSSSRTTMHDIFFFAMIFAASESIFSGEMVRTLEVITSFTFSQSLVELSSWSGHTVCCLM